MCVIYIHPKLGEMAAQGIANELTTRGFDIDEHGNLIAPLEEQPKLRVSYAPPGRGEHEITRVRQYVRGGFMGDEPEPPKPAA
ncbi:MAG: hypothetical protein LAT50_16890 [Ectothiorhodospiraceae bacterium]|nr:hypothetical protein [Ectothiorhodospiraceae bacterium]